MLFYSVAILIAGLDQLLKSLVASHLVVGQSVPLIDHALKLTYVRNTGAAFSLFVGFSPYLALIGLIVTGAVIYLHHRSSPKNIILQVGLALVLGGSCGNLLDRVFRSYVIDYLDLAVWPVFNLADVMINAGVAVLAYKLLLKEKNDVSNPS